MKAWVATMRPSIRSVAPEMALSRYFAKFMALQLPVKDELNKNSQIAMREEWVRALDRDT